MSLSPGVLEAFTDFWTSAKRQLVPDSWKNGSNNQLLNRPKSNKDLQLSSIWFRTSTSAKTYNQLIWELFLTSKNSTPNFIEFKRNSDIRQVSLTASKSITWFTLWRPCVSSLTKVWSMSNTLCEPPFWSLYRTLLKNSNSWKVCSKSASTSRGPSKMIISSIQISTQNSANWVKTLIESRPKCCN